MENMKLSEELQEIADMGDGTGRELNECIELAKKLEAENKELSAALQLSYYYEAFRKDVNHYEAMDSAREKVKAIKAKAVESEA